MSSESVLIVKKEIERSIRAKQMILDDDGLIDCIAEIAKEIAKTIAAGGKVVICGNGGSASDAIHFASEIVGRLENDSPAWPAIAINTDVAAMTAISNDYGYENVFARQAEALVTKQDFFVGISTSGKSPNVIKAVEIAEKKGAKTAALLGKDGGVLKDVVDYPVVVKENTTMHVQECHICIIHIICELVEKNLMGK